MSAKNYEVRVMVGKTTKLLTVTAENDAEARMIAGRSGRVVELKRIRSAARFDKMSLADRMIFFQRLGAMLASKVGTTEALDILYQSFGGHIKEASRILRDRIKMGATLPDAMEFAGPSYFPVAVVAIIKTGARGGDMAYAVKEAARFEKELAVVRKAAKKGLWSASMGFVIGVLTLIASHFYVAPQILGSSLVKFAKGGLDVDWVMTTSAIVTWAGIGLLAVAVIVFSLGVVFRPLAPAAMDRFIQRIPFYRDLVMARNNYMVFFGLAVLLKAGLRVEEAFRLTIETAPKGELRNDLERALAAIVQGSSEPWANKMRMLHPTDRAALATAQDRTQVATTIHELSLQYQALYHSRLEVFTPVAQMLAAVFLSLAGFVLFAVSTIPLLQTMSSVLSMM